MLKVGCVTAGFIDMQRFYQQRVITLLIQHTLQCADKRCHATEQQANESAL